MSISLRTGDPEAVLGPPMTVSWRESLTALSAFLALSVAYLRIDLERFLTAVAPDQGDPLFVLSILRWGAEQARLGFADFWNPTFFFPSRGVLALSDHLVGPAIGMAFLEGLGLPPAAGYNVLLLAAFAGSAFTAYLVLRWSGLSRAGAGLGALAWSFSGFRWQELSHLQVLLTPWLPLVLWHFDRLLVQPSPRRAGCFLIFYLLHIAGGAYLAYLIHLPLAVLVSVRLRGHGRSWLGRRSAATFVATAVLAGGSYLALYFPYRESQNGLRTLESFQLVRPFLSGLFSWFEVGSRTFWAQWLPQALISGDGGQFLGVLPSLLILAGAWLWMRRQKAEVGGLAPAGARSSWLRFVAVAAGLLALVAADLITLRADLHSYSAFRDARGLYYACAAVVLLASLLWWLTSRGMGSRREATWDTWWTGLAASGLVAAFASMACGTMVFRALIPGFTSIRVPERLFVISSFALAALSGRALDALLARVGRAALRRALAGAALVLVILELQPVHKFIQWVQVPSAGELPEVYRWLADHDEVRAVLELPMLDYWRESGRLYLWTHHLRPLVNGYSGYLPPGYLALKQRFSVGPEALDFAALERLGVTHLVIHLDELKGHHRRAFRRWVDAVDEGGVPPLRVVLRSEDSAVVELADGRSAATTRIGSQ